MEKQWDSDAIDGVYDQLIEQTGKLLDFVSVHGLGMLFKSNPVLSVYLKLVEALERELLIQWKIKSEEGEEILFLRQKKWLRESLRKEGSVFEIWGKLVKELSGFLDEFSVSQDKMPWSRFLMATWLDIDFWKQTGWCQGDKLEKNRRVCDGYLILDALEPYHLILSFLNLIELGCGTRPDIWPLISEVLDEDQALVRDDRIQTRLYDNWKAKSESDSIYEQLPQFWEKNSGGMFSQFPAFFVDAKENGKNVLKGVQPEKRIGLDELVGIDRNVERLKENTENFLNDHYSHHMLLWGGRGTGKSSCVLALLEKYVDEGLRLIEMPLSTLHLLPEISRKLKGKKEKFLIFCDDLSFDKGDESYKHLKSVMDGSVLSTAKNMLLIATSNKKDLVFRGEPATLYVTPEENQRSDEKRAIDDRFGLKLFFDVPVFKDLKEILFYYAEKTGLDYKKEELFLAFRQFAQRNNHDKPAGRTVKQFISEWADRNK